MSAAARGAAGAIYRRTKRGGRRQAERAAEALKREREQILNSRNGGRR